MSSRTCPVVACPASRAFSRSGRKMLLHGKLQKVLVKAARRHYAMVG